MLIGYARTSTMDQVAGFDAQKRELERLGAERVFAEQLSAKDADRPELQKLLGFVRQGDVVIVTKLDRLARSLKDVLEIAAQIETQGATLRIADMGLDTSTPTGKLMVGVLGSVAEFERNIMLERQRAGIAKAKGEGRYKGRAPTARAKADDIRRLAREGMNKIEIARTLDVSRASVYRVLSDSRPADTAHDAAA
jgi:DNA invertase Pin-like site-specific DNA recombinase